MDKTHLWCDECANAVSVAEGIRSKNEQRHICPDLNKKAIADYAERAALGLPLFGDN